MTAFDHTSELSRNRLHPRGHPHMPNRSSIADSSPACIDAHREVYGVEPNCKVLPITPSTYREHVARRDAIRRRRLLARGAMRFCTARPSPSSGPSATAFT